MIALLSLSMGVWETPSHSLRFTVVTDGPDGRGLQVEVRFATETRTVFVEEMKLLPLRDIFRDLSRDLARLTARSTPRGGLGFLGSCKFRETPGAYSLLADYQYAGGGAPALRVFGTNLPYLLFPGHTPDDLAEVLDHTYSRLESMRTTAIGPGR